MNKTLKAILWIASGFIALILTVLLQIIVRFVFNTNDGAIVTIINIFSWLGGVAGVVLLFVGPVVGIVTLVKK